MTCKKYICMKSKKAYKKGKQQLNRWITYRMQVNKIMHNNINKNIWVKFTQLRVTFIFKLRRNEQGIFFRLSEDNFQNYIPQQIKKKSKCIMILNIYVYYGQFYFT